MESSIFGKLEVIIELDSVMVVTLVAIADTPEPRQAAPTPPLLCPLFSVNSSAKTSVFILYILEVHKARNYTL